MDILNGRYKLVRQTASDLVGVTWIAEDMENGGKTVRLRLLSVDASETGYVQFLIQRYIQLGTFSHPNLVQALEMEVLTRINGRPHPTLQYFYTTEYLDRGGCVSYLDLTEAERVETVRQICYALNYIHFRGFAYKYLNFNTLFIYREPEGLRVKLCDLPTVTHFREQLGAFSDEVEQFLPPEIIRDNESNPSSDIYSLGVLIYYLFRQIPFEECSFDGARHEEMDGDILRLVEIMTYSSPSERFVSILEFMESFATLYPVDFPFTDRPSYERLHTMTPLVSREREFRKIMEVARQRMEMRSDVRHIVIQGEPGIGKSRLLREVSFVLHMQRVQTTRVSLPHRHPKGNYVFRMLLKELIAAGNISQELIKKYGSEIVKILPEMENAWKVAPSEALEEGPEQMRLNNRIYNFILEHGQTMPMVVLIDGLGNVSAQDFAVLEYLMNTRRKLPVLFVSTLRDESTPYYQQISRWISGGACEVVQLNKFGFTEAAELIQNMLGIGTRPIALAARIMGEAAGNPQAIEEAIRTLFMFEYLHVTENRTWSDPSEYLKDLELSLINDEPMDHALDFFDEKSRRVLEWISIFDSPAPREVLDQMSELDGDEIAGLLETLVAGKVLNRKLGDWGYTFDFYNKKLRKRILAEVTPQERNRLHRIAADYLEEAYRAGNGSITETLIHHLTNSGQLEKSATYAQALAKQMEEMNHNRQALEFYAMALGLLKELQLEDPIPALMVHLGDVHLKLNDSEKALSYFDEAAEIAERKGQHPVTVDARIRHANILIFMKEFTDLEGTLKALMQECKGLRYLEGELEAALSLCRVHLAFGRFGEIRGLVSEYLGTTREKGLMHYYGRLLNEKGICDIYENRTSDAFMTFLESSACLEKSGSAMDLTRPLNNLGILNFDHLGDLEKSREYFNRAIQISEKSNTVWGLDMLYSNLSETYLKEDQYRKALDYLHKACRLAEEAQHNDMLFYIYSNLCLTHLASCQYDEAYRYLSKLDYEYLNRKGHALNVAMYFLSHIQFAVEMRQFQAALEWYHRAYDEKINIPDNLEFVFKLLKLKIDHLNPQGDSGNNLLEYLGSLIKATTNPLEIRLIREVILDLALESLNANRLMVVQRLLALDAELIDVFDTARFQLRRAHLAGVFIEDRLPYYEVLLKQGNLEEYPTECWLIHQALGGQYEKSRDVYKALVHDYYALEGLKSITLKVPEKYRESFVLQDEMKLQLYRQIHWLVRRIQNTGKSGRDQELLMPTDVQAFFDVRDEERILDNRKFRLGVYKLYTERFGERIEGTDALIAGFGPDEYRNLTLCLRYLVQITFADRGFLFLNKEAGAESEVIVADGEGPIPDLGRYLSMLEFEAEGLLIRSRFDLKGPHLHRKPNESLMILPIRYPASGTSAPTGRRKHETGDKAGRVLGYLYLQSEKPFNNFTEKSFRDCSGLIRSLCVLVENYTLKRTSVIDKLTSVYLRKHIEARLNEELEKAKERSLELSIVMADIDHFKNVNDVYGHQKGDEILSEIGRIIRTNLRKGDLVGRYGGEEFILVLPDTGEIDAYKVCEKIRECIVKSQLLGEDSQLTISLGVSSFPSHGIVEEELIEKADQALYESKHMGRNRTTIWTSNIGITKQRFDKLTGILEGNISSDSRKVQAIVEIMNLITRHIAREAKIYEILSHLIDISEAQHAALFRLTDGTIAERFGRSIGVEGLDRNPPIADSLIHVIHRRGYGDYFIDWADVRPGQAQGIPDWNSYIAIPLPYRGELRGVLVLSVPISKHEFDFNAFNYVNTLSGVISVVLNEQEEVKTWQ